MCGVREIVEVCVVAEKRSKVVWREEVNISVIYIEYVTRFMTTRRVFIICTVKCESDGIE